VALTLPIKVAFIYLFIKCSKDRKQYDLIPMVVHVREQGIPHSPAAAGTQPFVAEHPEPSYCIYDTTTIQRASSGAGRV